MPALPDLPPLPQTDGMAGQGSTYAGVVGGLTVDTGTRGTFGLVVGHTFFDGALVGGLETMGLIKEGSASLEGGLRLGVPVTDTIGVFSQASLGADSANGAFIGLGGGLDYKFSDALTWRAQYRHVIDLSKGPNNDRLMVGAMFNF